jgi:hypothetical protein
MLAPETRYVRTQTVDQWSESALIALGKPRRYEVARTEACKTK